jgi:hypothetical protein
MLLKNKTIVEPLPVAYLVLGLFDFTAFKIVSAKTLGDDPFLSALANIFACLRTKFL